MSWQSIKCEELHLHAENLSRRVWELLMLLPTCPNMLQAFQNISDEQVSELNSSLFPSVSTEAYSPSGCLYSSCSNCVFLKWFHWRVNEFLWWDHWIYARGLFWNFSFSCLQCWKFKLFFQFNFFLKNWSELLFEHLKEILKNLHHYTISLSDLFWPHTIWKYFRGHRWILITQIKSSYFIFVSSLCSVEYSFK